MTQLPHGLLRLAVRHQGLTVATVGAITVALGAGMFRLETNVGYRAFLGESHPVIRDLDAFLRRFGGGLPMVAVWSCAESPACESVFDPSSLAMAHDVAAELAKVEGIRRVDSPATSPLLAPAFLEPFPRARRLAPEGRPAADLGDLVKIALSDPLWVGQLVSTKGDAGAVVVHLASSDGPTSFRVFDALESAVAPWSERGFRFHFAGGPVEFVVAGRELQESSAALLPLMIAVVWAVLVLLFGSWVAVTVSFLAVGLAVVWTRGAMGWLGWPETSFTQAMPPLLLVIGVCDSVHLLARCAARLSGTERARALEGAVVEVGPPCTMTTLTTAAGFASLASSPLESIARFGLLASAGVLAALFLTFTLLPVIVLRLPEGTIRAARHERRWRAVLLALGRFAERRRAAVFAGTALLAVAALAGLRQLRIDASFEEIYGKESRVVRWADAVGRYLRDPDTLEISIEPSPSEGSLPAALAVVDRLGRRLEGGDGLGRSRSLVDPVRRLNDLVHRDRLVLDGGTDDKGRPGSLVRLLRAEDAGVTDLLYDRASGALRLSIEARKLPQDRLRATLAAVRLAVAAELPAGWRATVTGPLAVVGEMIDEIRATQLRSFALAALIVFFSVVAFLRSVAYGSLAMLPTVVPVLVTLGGMGFAGVALDIGSAMVAAVVLGLAVDNAIHLLWAHRALRAEGLSPTAAAHGALQQTGRPVAITALALGAGFLTLMLSPWHSIASFGLVSGLAIGSALIAALLLLPAALVREPLDPSAAVVNPTRPC